MGAQLRGLVTPGSTESDHPVGDHFFRHRMKRAKESLPKSQARKVEYRVKDPFWEHCTAQ